MPPLVTSWASAGAARIDPREPSLKSVAAFPRDTPVVVYCRVGYRSARVASWLRRQGFKTVYDKTYPPSTTDYTPIVRAIAANNPDIFLACSYPADSVGLIRASHEVGFKPKIFGGGMVGLQATAIKTQLGPLLNNIVVYDFWLPWAGFANDAGREFVKKYQAKAADAGVDLLGYYLPPFAYARMEVIEQAVGREAKDRGDYFLDPGGKARHRGNEPTAPYLFASVSICDSRLFRTAPDGPFSLLRLWNRAQAAGHLYGLVHDGQWFHVGTPQALAEAERALA
mgnify:CR=1 FL=1